MGCIMKSTKNILIAFILNLSFSIFELIGGIFTNSIAIISDALHDFSDAISIFISYFLEKKSIKKPDENYTFGYTRYSVLGAIIMNVILISGSFLIIYHSIVRLFNPVEVNYNGMFFLAIVGVLMNLFAVYFTKDGHSLNQKAVNLHMLEDVLGWIIVLIGSIIMKFSKINIIDGILSIGVSFFIMIHAIKSLKKTIDLILEKKPSSLDIEHLRNHLKEIESIVDIHHIHAWSMDGTNNYITMHVVIDSDDFENIKGNIKTELKEFNITHSTIEFEKKNYQCLNKDCHIEFESSVTHTHHH